MLAKTFFIGNFAVLAGICNAAPLDEMEGKSLDLDAPRIGVSFADLPDELPRLRGVKEYRWPKREAVLVAAVWDGGSAKEAKMEPGIVVINVDKKRVSSAEQAVEALKKNKPGDTVQIVYYTPVNVKGKLRWKRKASKLKVGTKWNLIKSQMATSSDKLTGITRYNHKDDPKGMSPNHVSCQVVLHKGNVYPSLRIMHRGDSWLFVRSYSFLIDGKRLDVKPAREEFTRDNSASSCWEWTNQLADPKSKNDEVWALLNKLYMCKQATVYYHGDDFRDEHELSFDERLAINVTLDFYQALRSGLRP